MLSREKRFNRPTGKPPIRAQRLYLPRPPLSPAAAMRAAAATGKPQFSVSRLTGPNNLPILSPLSHRPTLTRRVPLGSERPADTACLHESFMAGLAALAVLHCALIGADASAKGSSYAVALRQAQTDQRPLLVLVGADWCPGCRTMKQSVLPSLARRGGLGGVSFAMVDTDAESALARQLMRGGSIPQLIVFSPVDEGRWHREQITGATSEAGVQSLIARAVAAQQPRLQPAADSAGSAIGD
jgi:thiol-disulfide isomerase/thioredoxin